MDLHSLFKAILILYVIRGEYFQPVFLHLAPTLVDSIDSFRIEWHFLMEMASH